MPRPARIVSVADVVAAGSLNRVVAWVGAHPLVADGAAAGVLGVLLSALYAGRSPLIAVLVFVEVAGLAVRRVRPTVCAAVVFTAAFAHWLAYVLSVDPTQSPLLPSDVAVPMAVYAAAAYAARRVRGAALGVGLLGAVLSGSTVLVDRVPGASPDLVPGALAAVALGVVILLAWVSGQWRRTRLAYVSSVVDGARRAQAEHAQRVALAASDERARIAREMHDVVAHSLAVVVAQADGGRFAAARDPQAAVSALETVATTGRTALADMRRLLGVLRQEEGGTAPQPGLADLPALVDAVRATGSSVELVEDGPSRAVPSAEGLVVYRVVQESLTNALKHAGPRAHTTVTLRWTDRCLTVEVTDDGVGAVTGSGAGRGIAGMRERLMLSGGHLETGPGLAGGFRVHAELPLSAAGSG